MASKSHELGGQRSHVRHNGELTVAGVLGSLIVSFIPAGLLDVQQTVWVGILLTALFSAAFKFAHAKGWLPGLSVLGLFGILLIGNGCAVQLGVSAPESFTGRNGETIVACEVKGVSLAFGDAGICRNVEGGQASSNFVRLTLGLFEAVARGIGGAFSGLVTGISSPVATTVTVIEDHAAPPSAAAESEASNAPIPAEPLTWY